MSDELRRGRTARRRRQATAPVGFLLVQALLVDVVLVVGAAAAWPIYRDGAFLVLVAAALVLAHAIAYAGLRWRWSAWWVALATAGAYLVAGLPLAAPNTLTSLPDALGGLRAVATAPVTGWKDLLTLELPLGSYQATLAPALLVFLTAAVAALSIAWRSTRWWMLATPIALVPTVFGVAFGATGAADPIVLGPLSLPREAVVGAAALVAALAVIVWRTVHERRRAVAAAVAASGVRSSGGSNRSVVARIAVAATMIAVAAAGGVVAAPWALAGQPRDVLRADIQPRLEIAATLSPLAQYRGFFADDLVDEALFTVTAPEGVDRVRLATLPFYDGQVARVVDPDAEPSDPRTAFRRVPASLTVPPGAATGEASVEVGAYEGIWMPSVGAVTALRFEGDRASALADGFYYNTETAGAVQLASPGLDAGTRYRHDAAYTADPASVATLSAARDEPLWDDDLVPESLRTWIELQGSPEDGAGLVELVDTLRARGFLSHALAIDPAAPPLWTTDLGDYAFQPSRAGHSTDRIDRLFTDLLTRQNEVGGENDADLVAAVGDDEQFAVAAMMIADQLGFDARVVLGARLSSTDETLATCADGVCTGGDLAAWIEVRGADAAWVPLDTTPQHAAFPSPETQQRQDPQNPTEVRRDEAETVRPQESSPSDGGESEREDAPVEEDLSGLWAAVRIGGISLLAVLLVVGPFALIVLVKVWRRRGRRRTTDAVERFTGGWQEYVDAAVDHGHRVPPSYTRHELAVLYAGGTDGARLASWADRSVFDVAPPSEAESDEFWRIVDAERARFAGERGWWARWRARVSLRSLLRRRPTQGAQRRPGRRRRDG